MTQAALTLHFAAKGTVGEPEDERVQRVQARRIDVRSDPPLPVAADVKVIGETPARIEVSPGALRVICGNGPGLSRPVSGALVAAAVAEARSVPGPAATEAGDPSVGERALEVAGTAARAVVAAVAQRVAGSGESGPAEDQPKAEDPATPPPG
jgi:hypothetical protein